MPAARFPIEVIATARQRLGMPPARFLRDYWQKRPLLIRHAFQDFSPPLAPNDLAGLACMEGALARIVSRKTLLNSSFRTPRSGDPEPIAFKNVETLGYSPHPAAHPFGAIGCADVRSGILPAQSGLRRNDDKWNVLTGPFNEATFAKLPDSHWTLLVQDVDKWDADTAALLGAFAFLPSWRIDDVMVSYATDAGGVGAHVDQYDVFLLQGLGQRRWAIDTRPDPPTGFRDDVELKLLKEFSPTHEWILNPGDMLYLPPGVPHDGVANGECMTFSIGMRAPSVGELLFDFAAHVAESLPESQRFADPDLAVSKVDGEIDADALRRARRALGPASRMLHAGAFGDWFGCFITHYRSAVVPVPRKRPINATKLAEKLARSSVSRDPWSRFAWRRSGRDAVLYAAGEAFPAPAGWAAALADRAGKWEGAALLDLPRRKQGLGLLEALLNAGHLRLHAH